MLAPGLFHEFAIESSCLVSRDTAPLSLPAVSQGPADLGKNREESGALLRPPFWEEEESTLTR